MPERLLAEALGIRAIGNKSGEALVVSNLGNVDYPRITSDFETPAVPRTDVRVWATQAGYD